MAPTQPTQQPRRHRRAQQYPTDPQLPTCASHALRDEGCQFPLAESGRAAARKTVSAGRLCMWPSRSWAGPGTDKFDKEVRMTSGSSAAIRRRDPPRGMTGAIRRRARFRQQNPGRFFSSRKTAGILLLLVTGFMTAVSAKTVICYSINHSHAWPAVATPGPAGGPNSLVVWRDSRPKENLASIYAARMSPSLEVLDPNGFPVHVGGTSVSYPAVAAGVDEFFAVWQEDIVSPGIPGIYGTLVDSEGNVGEVVVVSEGNTRREYPAVAFSHDKHFVVWQQGMTEIYGARVTLDGQVLDPGGIPISTEAWDAFPSVASDGNRFLVVWQRVLEPGDPFAILAAFVEDDGSVGEVFVVEIDQPDERAPDVAFGAGAYLVAWQSRGGLEQQLVWGIWGRLCDVHGDVGPRITIHTADRKQTNPSVCFGGTNFFVAWQDDAGGDPEFPRNLLGRHVSPAGVTVGPVVTICDDPGEQANADVTFFGEHFIAVWDEGLLGGYPDIYGDTISRRLLSESPEATHPNWGRKLVRVPNSPEFNAVYQDDGNIFYTYSADNGATWSQPEFVGQGYDPALVLNEGYGGPILILTPWIVYRTGDGAIERAIRQGPGEWSHALVFSQPGMYAGAPTLAPSGPPHVVAPFAHVAYPVYVGEPPDHCFIYYNTFDESEVSPPYELDAAPENALRSPSIAVTPGSIVHVAWNRGDRIMYRVREQGQWSGIHPISITYPYVTEPASNPALEAYGDFIYCVWRGPNLQGEFPADVWQSRRWLWHTPDRWSDPENQSQTSTQESNFPVMATDFVTVWHEDVGSGNLDIWAKFAPDPSSRPLFQTPQPSRYPHADGYWEDEPGMVFLSNTIWTEELSSAPPVYEVRFDIGEWQPHFGAEYEPGLFYGVTVGDPTPSPYCRTRAGFRTHRSFSVDSGPDELVYDLRFLDPRRAYDARAVVYHEGKTDWLFELRADTLALARIRARPGVPETARVRIPDQAYEREARAELSLRKVAGEYVGLAGLKLFRVEDPGSGKGGPMRAGAGPVSVLRVEPNAPNPFRTRTAIRYQLPHAGRVLVRVFDPAGRQVRLLRDETQDPGRHSVVWDGLDSQGRVLPAGVYFYRVRHDNTEQTGRAVLAR